LIVKHGLASDASRLLNEFLSSRAQRDLDE
jgi:hypothetical protein